MRNNMTKNINVKFTEELKEQAFDAFKKNGFDNFSDFVRFLIKREIKRIKRLNKV